MSESVSLDLLPNNRPAVIEALKARGGLKRRLMELGVLVGTEIRVLRAAPITGDPLQVRLRGFDLALRRADAELVMVRPVDE